MKVRNYAMGRKRLSEDEKKVRIHIYLKKEYVELLRARGINISNLINQLVKKYLNK
jgi:post-segregation antitoxin (ccd killing protein)